MGGPQPSWRETQIPVGHGSEGFDVSPDGKEIWVANAQDGTISIIEVASKKVVQTLDANVHGANRLKFTPMESWSLFPLWVVPIWLSSTSLLAKRPSASRSAAALPAF